MAVALQVGDSGIFQTLNFRNRRTGADDPHVGSCGAWMARVAGSAVASAAIPFQD